MTTDYVTDSFDTKQGAFRVGGQITLNNLRQQYYRDSIAYFLCFGLVEEAIGKGFDIVDKKTQEPVPWNDAFQVYLERDLDEIVRSLALERRDGASLAAFLEEENEEDLLFRAYPKQDYEPKYHNTGKLKTVKATSKIADHPVEVVHDLTEEETALQVKQLLYRRREKINQGMSYLEPIWDDLIAVYFLISNLAYYLAKNGGGIKAVELDYGDLSIDQLTEEQTTDLLKKLSEFSGVTDVVILPPGVKLLTDLLTSGSSVNWMQCLDTLLVPIVIHSSVPNTRLKGVTPGQLEGAQVNEETYFDVLRDLQKLVTAYLKWYVRTLNKKYAFYKDEKDEEGQEVLLDYDLLFNVREEMSEFDQLTLELKKLALVEKYISLGASREEAFKRGGLDVPSMEQEQSESLDPNQEDEEE